MSHSSKVDTSPGKKGVANNAAASRGTTTFTGAAQTTLIRYKITNEDKPHRLG